MPLLTTASEQLQGTRELTRLYFLVWLPGAEDCMDEWNTTSSHFECLIITYGLVKTPSVFSVLSVQSVALCTSQHTPTSLLASLEKHINQVRAVLAMLFWSTYFIMRIVLSQLLAHNIILHNCNIILAQFIELSVYLFERIVIKCGDCNTLVH